MCGIAGYNVSGKWAKLHLSQPKTENILQEAWFHNVHRGWDAAGYFSVNMDDEIQVFKSPGVAPQIFHSDIFEQGKLMASKVLAAHTRAPSTGAGEPSKNENNHPVGFGGVWTTHNGTLWNDEDIKEEIVGKAKVKDYAVVDSLAISMKLSLESPTNFENILEALGEIRGAFSIHSIWQTHPNVSLLARSSTNNPFIMAVNTEDQGIFYGSEKESVWAMLTEAGQDPNDKELWEWRSLDPGHAILVEDGRVINWGSFEGKTGWSSAARLKYTMHRWLPKEGKRKRTEVYSTDHEFDYVNKARRASFYNTEIGTLLYTREGGFTEAAEDEGFPYSKGELEWGAVFAEADEIRKDGDLIHVFYGGVEIVAASNGRIVRDVFNHDLFTKHQRWTKVKKKRERTVKAVDGWDDFWRLRTTGIHSVPNTPTEYAYIAELELEHSKKLQQIGYGTRNGEKIGVDNVRSLIGLKEMKPQIELSWGEVYNQIVVHKKHPTLKFLVDGICPTHPDQSFTEHTDPFQCKLMLHAASFTMASFVELDLHRIWHRGKGENGEGQIVYQMPDGSNMCEVDNKSCYWAITEDVAFVNETDEVYWKTITQEECVVCGTIRFLDRLPAWTGMLDTFPIEGSIYAS